MENGVLEVISNLVQQIEVFNATVSRKLSMAIAQLKEAKSIESYQQIGILIRDTLIEFGQSIYNKNMLVEGETVPSDTDAKRMIEYTLNYYGVSHEGLSDFVKTCWSYAVAIQHDSNVKKESAVQTLSMTSLCIALIIEAINQSGTYKKRLYYKCPICGSLDLKVEEHWERDIDAAWKMDKIICSNCGWYYIEELGGMSGVE
jgi:hypothetical protein